MELRYFRLIKTIAEEGNIANSSERLFLTQSALSHQLKEIEENLGFRIFHRSRNNWKLTTEGQELYKVANQVLDTIEKGFNAIHYIQEGSRGKIRISTECYTFYQGLPSFIQKMGLIYPEIEVDLILDATKQPISKILSNEIDFALVTSKPTSDELLSVAIFEDEIFALLHRENELSAKDYLEAADFVTMHLIIHSYPIESVSVYEHFLKSGKIIPAKITAIPLTEVSLEMVGANMGVMCMPAWALKSFKIPDEVVMKSIGKNGLRRTHYLVARKGDMHKKYVSDFMTLVEEDFRHL